MVVGAKVCELTEDLLWFVCGNFDVFPKHELHTVSQLLMACTKNLLPVSSGIR